MGIRDYLARPQLIKKDENGKEIKVDMNIPTLKTFERAMLMPAEVQEVIEQKAYPDSGSGLMVNPFPKKKAKGKKGKKGKKGRR